MGHNFPLKQYAREAIYKFINVEETTGRVEKSKEETDALHLGYSSNGQKEGNGW